MSNRAEGKPTVDQHHDVDGRDQDGWRPLDHAAGQGDLTQVAELLAAGADPCAQAPDGRTAYDIAVSAGQVETAKALRAAMADGGTAADYRWRPYCRAYPIGELRDFPGWPNDATDNRDQRAVGDAEGFEDLVFLHDDLTVTGTPWPGEHVIFDQVTAEWERYCRVVLQFRVPDDLDLAVPAGTTEPGPKAG